MIIKLHIQRLKTIKEKAMVEKKIKKMKTHEGKACFMFAYCFVMPIILQSFCNYCLLQT